jgi:predicted DNA-binding transcriptional regulator AlpA
VKDKPVSAVMLTQEMCRITGYSAKTLYLLAARGIAKPAVTSHGVRVWSQADVDAIAAHRAAMRPQRLARLFGNAAAVADAAVDETADTRTVVAAQKRRA